MKRLKTVEYNKLRTTTYNVHAARLNNLIENPTSPGQLLR